MTQTSQQGQSAEWYYLGGPQRERMGPVGFDVLRDLASSGRLAPDALVWRAGMQQWSPASTLPGLFAATAPAPVGAPIGLAQAAPSAAIAYYTPAGGIPPRAAETLRGHASPTGDTGDWPLDDARAA